MLKNHISVGNISFSLSTETNDIYLYYFLNNCGALTIHLYTEMNFQPLKQTANVFNSHVSFNKKKL